MPALTHAGAELARAAAAAFAGSEGRAEVEAVESRAWASVTFSGERHLLRLRLDGDGAGPAADAFLDGLAEREFALRGHILVDIVLRSDRRDPGGACVRLALEALTVEEA